MTSGFRRAPERERPDPDGSLAELDGPNQRRTEDLLAEANARLLDALGESELRTTELSLSNKSLSLTIDALRKQIQRRQEAETALNSAKDAAERANRAKSTFLAAASHDLRQPLHSMRLLLAALPRVELSNSGREITGQLVEAAETMGRLLNSLLDLSKLDAGAVEPSFASVPTIELLGRLERFIAPLAREKRVSCRFVPRDATVRSDPDLLYEILQNFLTNAIRHGAGRPILVGCRRRGTNLRFEVWDRGEGIPEHELGSIFKEFYQVGTPQRDRDRGLGLGLAIVARLADLLGHTLEVRSAPDKGTLFAIQVPLVERPARRHRPIKRRVARTDRTARWDALIVEDNPKVARATDRLLRTWGFRTRVATSELRAIRAVQNGGCRPNLVILDYHLPRGTGITALKSIRSRLRYPVPGLIVTGHLTPTVLTAAKIEDCKVLQKPIDPEQLREAVEEMVPVTRPRNQKPRAAPTRTTRPKPSRAEQRP